MLFHNFFIISNYIHVIKSDGLLFEQTGSHKKKTISFYLKITIN